MVLGRFPVTFYKEQWRRVLGHGGMTITPCPLGAGGDALIDG